MVFRVPFDNEGQGYEFFAGYELEVVDEKLNQLEEFFLDLLGLVVNSLSKLGQRVLALQQKVIGIVRGENCG